MNTAILGGTFNPFHIGHYEMLKAVCELKYIDRVIVIPDSLPPHKDVDFLASNEDRINMCKIACEDFDKAYVSTIEIENKGKSYTINTIKRLKELYPDDEFYFACGGDMIEMLDRWYDFDNLIKLTAFIAFDRPDMSNLKRDYDKMTELGANIVLVDHDIPSVSSSHFRETLSKDLLPKKIYEYIISKGIYDAQ